MHYFLFALALLMALPAQANTKVFRDIAYGSHRLQKLDVYQPDSCRQANCPVVIWVHGGGWRMGSKNIRAKFDMIEYWAGRGIVMVATDYRLSPDATHPAHVQDVAASIAWTHKNVSRYGGNPARISLLGHSAGAHLVALVGTSPSYLAAHGLAPANLRHVFPIDTASFDLTDPGGRMVGGMIKDAFGTEPDVLREASPIFNVRPGYHYPAFIISAAKARPDAVATSQDLAARLRKVGAIAEVMVMDYSSSRQMRAHAAIAQDLANADSAMTKKLIAAVLVD
jgi:acetyl esterase/lipase